MRRTFSIPRLCRAAKNKLYYSRKLNEIAIVDQSGHFGLITNDQEAFEELQERSGSGRIDLQNRAGLFELIHHYAGRQGQASYADTGIRLFMWLYGKNTPVAVLQTTDANGCSHYKYVDCEIMSVFTPVSITAGQKWSDTVVVTGLDYIGVVLPVRPHANQVRALSQTLRDVSGDLVK